MSPVHPASILIVDDDALLRKALRTSLRPSGFAVEEARSGDEALAMVERRLFDLVLLDINMPGISGIEACRRVRAISPRIGIIMITVRDSDDDKIRALDAGADDYLAKPFKVAELTGRIRVLLGRIRAPNSPNALASKSEI
jgi:two-component system, OmpR family, KDP operon response regulator KdpE